MANHTYVLVHGSWMGKFCWVEVVPRLETLESTVLTLDLPAHGDDPTPAENASLDGYRDAVLNVIGDRHNIILVGHSMAGMVISAVAEAIPAQIRSLVYLCAYLPQNGENLYQLSSEDQESLVGTYWRQEHPESYSPAWVAPEGVVKVFGADCPPQYQELILQKHRPEPVPPLATPIALTAARYGTVPRFYIETLEDRTVSHQLQTLMLSRAGVQKRFQLSSSHCPFFSVPDQLVAHLTESVE
ncbi:alpha/beta fold hydrolase [Stenomitos frigidus]|uniref:Alpha/beta hydrolase n=1 Tax=Stenomitos frigidus ULC18 TaxID=2107698 RepID=A0A2T1EDL1_9CYAN|nr:alpha/beta fold hydrolase [Stenomitos frigidus]PSB30788.1 alpha/beta hydrolase [Stenomitos frigidus ULC18]